jgi:hypothetical protein
MTNPTRTATIATIKTAIDYAAAIAGLAASGEECAREHSLYSPMMTDAIAALNVAPADVVARAVAAFKRHGFNVVAARGGYTLTAIRGL